MSWRWLAGLPADFKRMRDGLELMLHTLRAEIVESNATKGITMGEVLEADKRLRGTSEGRTYESFTAFLNDEEQQQRFRQAIAEALERDFADALDAEDRRALQRLMPQLRAQSAEIHRIYGRLSESMHTFVQSDESANRSSCGRPSGPPRPPSSSPGAACRAAAPRSPRPNSSAPALNR